MNRRGPALLGEDQHGAPSGQCRGGNARGESKLTPRRYAVDRLNELLARISDLSDDELQELRQLVLSLVDKGNKDPGKVYSNIEGDELAILASAATAVRSELDRRELVAAAEHADRQTLQEF